MAKKIFILEIDDEDIGVKSLYHIFDNTWLYKKTVIREQEAAEHRVQADGAACAHENMEAYEFGRYCKDCGMANPPRR